MIETLKTCTIRHFDELMKPKCSKAEPSELFNIFSYIHKDSLLIPAGCEFSN